MKNFKNKVAAITGAGSGIGQQLAILLAKQGCHLSISDINEKGLAQTVEILKEYPVTVTTKVLDVSNCDAVKQWAQETVQDHGCSHKFQSTPQGISLSIYIYRYIDIYNRHIHTYYSNLQNGHRGKFRCSVQLLHRNHVFYFY